MRQPVSRKERQETKKWKLLFALIAELNPSTAVKRAGAIIFAGFVDQSAATHKKTRARPKTNPEMLLRSIHRAVMLSTFKATNPKATDCSIYKPAKVHRGDWNRWRSGEMKDSSTMAMRITKTLLADGL